MNGSEKILWRLILAAIALALLMGWVAAAFATATLVREMPPRTDSYQTVRDTADRITTLTEE